MGFAMYGRQLFEICYGNAGGEFLLFWETDIFPEGGLWRGTGLGNALSAPPDTEIFTEPRTNFFGTFHASRLLSYFGRSILFSSTLQQNTGNESFYFHFHGAVAGDLQIFPWRITFPFAGQDD